MLPGPADSRAEAAPSPAERTAWNRDVVTWADQSDVRYRQLLKLLGWSLRWWQDGTTEPLSLDELARRARHHWPSVAQSRRTLARRLAEAERAGLVTVVRTGQAPGLRNGANRYRLDLRAAMVAGAAVAGQRDFGTARPDIARGQRDFGTASPGEAAQTGPGTAIGTAVGTAIGTANPAVSPGHGDFGTAYGSTDVRKYVRGPVVAKRAGSWTADAGESQDSQAPAAPAVDDPWALEAETEPDLGDYASGWPQHDLTLSPAEALGSDEGESQAEVSEDLPEDDSDQAAADDSEQLAEVLEFPARSQVTPAEALAQLRRRQLAAREHDPFWPQQATG